MNVKEYVFVNNYPLLDNPKNLFMLEWLETKAFCTPSEISEYTRIPQKEVNDILQTLYKNSLVSFSDERYKITFNGIKMLNSMGLSDLQIKNLLSQTAFKSGELSLYKSLFEIWRTDFLDIYLMFFNILDGAFDDIYQSTSKITSYLSKISTKETYTILVATLLHDMGNILYTNETSKLMNYYTDLHNYCSVNYCYSSEIYHRKSKHWETNTQKSDFSKYVSKYFKDKLFHTYSIYANDLETKQQVRFLKPTKYYAPNTINRDFDLSCEILSNSSLLNSILTSQNLNELSSSLHLTKAQTKFILKNIRAKIDTLLPTEATILKQIKS